MCAPLSSCMMQPSLPRIRLPAANIHTNKQQPQVHHRLQPHVPLLQLNLRESRKMGRDDTAVVCYYYCTVVLTSATSYVFLFRHTITCHAIRSTNHPTPACITYVAQDSYFIDFSRRDRYIHGWDRRDVILFHSFSPIYP